MPRFVAPPTLPTVSALPAGIAGMQVMYQNVPWYFDGTTWVKNSAASGVQWVTQRVNVDAGGVPVPEFTWAAYTGGQANVNSIVFGTLDYSASGKDDDEVEMDIVDVWCKPQSDGSIAIRLTGMTGFIAGAFTVDLIYTKAA